MKVFLESELPTNDVFISFGVSKFETFKLTYGEVEGPSMSFFTYFGGLPGVLTTFSFLSTSILMVLTYFFFCILAIFFSKIAHLSHSLNFLISY